jgi:transposase
VGAMGFSSYTFAEAIWSQELPCWIGSHIHAFEYSGGLPMLVTPDNPKSDASRPRLLTRKKTVGMRVSGATGCRKSCGSQGTAYRQGDERSPTTPRSTASPAVACR